MGKPAEPVAPRSTHRFCGRPKKLFKPHVTKREAGPEFYGYGWALSKTDRGTRLIAHNGGNGVFVASFRRYVDDDVVIILMVNYAETYPPKMMGGLLSIIFPQH